MGITLRYRVDATQPSPITSANFHKLYLRINGDFLKYFDMKLDISCLPLKEHVPPCVVLVINDNPYGLNVCIELYL
jgi:hypothetical protein